MSSTWSPNVPSPNKSDIFSFGLESNLGYTAKGQFGFDTVALGWQGSGGPVLDHQIVAGIADPDFYLGVFGLNPRPSNFTNFTNPVPSYLSSLKTQGLIPSLSWAYTAGNQYRLNKALGSLVLGGFDASRFVPNTLTILFNQQDIRDLTVNILQISTISKDGSQRTNLLSDGIPAFIDSTIPSIYLPVDVCKRFEDAFGIEWNESVQGYLVNDTLHESLRTLDPSVKFTISNSFATNSPSVDINLPYAAFDLVAEPPLMRNKSRYFPLMRATNESQYTLGRTFLQEAYLIADYERQNFSISQCSWVENAPQDIIALYSPSVNMTAESTRQLSRGAIAGITTGSVTAASVLIFVVYFFVFRTRRGNKKSDVGAATDSSDSLPAAELEIKEMTPEIEGTHPHGNEIDGHAVYGEMDGDAVYGEIDGHALHGPELPDTHPAGQELDGFASHEMEGSFAWPQELGIKTHAANELPGCIAASELGSSGNVSGS
ncbi:MAG: hypothetical protein Q9171_001035 [Xanthocarpia ochracea]